MNEAIEKTLELAKMYDKQAELMRKLAVALAIKAVWPEAFEGGRTIAVKGIGGPYGPGRKLSFRRCYLLRSDGVEFDINPDQYRAWVAGRPA